MSNNSGAIAAAAAVDATDSWAYQYNE